MAQTQEQEADRIPGIPEESIAVNFPRDFGDPGGVRSALAGRGVTYGINYLGDVLGNPVGGFEQSTRYIGRLEFQLAVDMEKAIGWNGLTFFTNGYQIHGQSISALNLGVLMPVSFIEALPSTRLFELWLQQELMGENLTLRVGPALGGFGVRHQPGGERFRQRLVGLAVDPGHQPAGRRPGLSAGGAGGAPRLQSERHARLPHRRVQRRSGERLRGSSASLQSARPRLSLQPAAAAV